MILELVEETAFVGKGGAFDFFLEGYRLLKESIGLYRYIFNGTRAYVWSTCAVFYHFKPIKSIDRRCFIAFGMSQRYSIFLHLLLLTCVFATEISEAEDDFFVAAFFAFDDPLFLLPPANLIVMVRNYI